MLKGHPHVNFTGTSAKNSTPTAFNPSTNLPTISHHPFCQNRPDLTISIVSKQVRPFLTILGNAPRPWGMQPNTSLVNCLMTFSSFAMSIV